MTSPEPLPPPRHFRVGYLRYSSVELLVVLFLLIGLTPFFEDLPNGELIETCMMTVVLVSAMLAVGGRRRTFLVAFALIVPALLCNWLNHLHPNLVSPYFFLGFATAFIAFIVVNLFRFILRSSHVTGETICAAISIYILLGLIWTQAYTIIGLASPGSFSFTTGSNRMMDRFNAFYLSFVTLSTVGFGDVTPVSKFARTLAVLEAVTGTFYVTVLVARLVSLYSPSRTVTKDKSSHPESQG